MPEATGDFGDAPEFRWPDGDPSADLQVQVLSEGDGRSVAEQSVVSANYAGYVWDSDDAFDSSYARGAATGFSLNQVVKGWSEGIPDHTVGSRLLISVPPAYGYGESGNPQAGIAGTDTIVFVVDLLEDYAPDQFGDPDAEVVADEAHLPFEVDGAPGEPFTTSVPEGADAPDDGPMIQLTRGSGAEVTAGQSVVLTYSITDWDSGQTLASWNEDAGGGPIIVPVGKGDVWDDVAGMTVGSRTLLVEPADDANAALAIVADIIGIV